MREGALVVSLFLLCWACANAKSPSAPIAVGPEEGVRAATRAARACGMKDIRHDPLDDKRSMLLIGSGNSYRATDCTLGWIKKHWSKYHFEPLFIGNERR
jgi:hypothetical protein